ncbi:hypothetical protein BG011_008465 [Mortierella polycephala]|uniref:Uncharacterized protein n=1 Tax=Mortierella polycephala TaxID=41804 RepID=A0A9P6QD34_9FUNG|nr:hypothetical protein BG011_008465 [Mortierella polycephala]
MVYVNSTTATIIAAGLGAAAYYLYMNVIEPHQKAQKEFQVEQAQRELLKMEEEELTKRGTNKQAAKKKQAPATSHQKKDGHQRNDDRGAEEVNPNGTEMGHRAAMNRKERRKVAGAAVDGPAQVQVADTETTKNEQPLKGQQETAREPEVLGAPEPAMLARDGPARDTRHPHAHESLDPIKPVKARGSPNTASTSTSMSSSFSIAMTVTKEVSEKVEQAVPNHKLAALQALLKAKEHALIAADARVEEANHRIIELQKRAEADAETVKVAKKTETGTQTLARENQNAAEKNPKQGDNTRVAELEARVEGLEQRRIQAKAQIKQLQELDQEKRQELNEAEHRADAATQEKEEIHRQAMAILSEKDEIIANLEKNLAALEGELEAAKMQVEQYVDAVEHLEAVSRTQCESLESEKCSLFEETEMLRSELADDSEMRKRQETELRRVQTQLSKVKSEHSECAAQYDEILVAKKNLVLELLERTQEFEAMMEGKAATDARLKAMTEGKAATDARLKAFVQESREKRMELEEEYDVLSLRVVELEHQLAGFQQKETREKSEAKNVKVSEAIEGQVASEPKQGLEEEYLEQVEKPSPFSLRLGIETSLLNFSIKAE